VSRSPRTRRTGTAAAIGALIGALALAGCGAGQITQTDTQVAAVDGALATVGFIAIRDAQIEFGEAEGVNVYSRGGEAPLSLTIANTGADADKLVSVSSPAAASVKISGTPDIAGGRVLVVEGEPEGAAEPTAPSGSARPTGTAAATPTSPAPTSTAPTSTASATPSATASANAEGPGAATGKREAQIVLTGLTDDIRSGLTYPVTFRFERAGEVTVNVPVANPDTPRQNDAPE
jgi:copper(I)-binding protein